MGDGNRPFNNQLPSVDSRLRLVSLKELLGHRRVIRDLDEVHPEDLNTSQPTPFLQHLAHILGDNVRVVQQRDLKWVGRLVLEATRNTARHIESLVIDELSEVLNNILCFDWVVNHVVNHSVDVHGGSSGIGHLESSTLLVSHFV